MLGLNEYTMIECEVCKNGWSLSSSEVELLQSDKNYCKTKIKCSCNNEFTYLDGVINAMTSDNVFSGLHFISNIQDYGNCEITIGYSQIVKFNRDIPVINDLMVTCQDGFAYVKALPLSEKEFMINSSQLILNKDSPIGDPMIVPVGEKLTVSWRVWGRSGWDNVFIWQRYLVQAREEITSKNYNIALLTCEIAFESFINSTLYDLLTAKGLTDEVIDLMLKSINIFDKVYKLLLQLDGIKFKDCDVHAGWDKLAQMRNKVGHGKIADITEEEAKEAFMIVIKGIVYINLSTTI